MNIDGGQYRLLVVDDNVAIHDDFRKILCPSDARQSVDAAASVLFGQTKVESDEATFEVHSAYQGQDGLARVLAAQNQGLPYSIVFVDMEMPPGWDGLETAQRILSADAHVQVVICTAFSNRSWSEIVASVDDSERLLLIKKPFDVEEILQLSHSLAQRWTIGHEARLLADVHSEKLVQANEQIQVQVQERLVAETALGQSEQRLKLALEATNDGIFDWDMDGNKIYFSPRWEKMLGFQPGTVASRPGAFRELMHPDDVRVVFSLLRKHIKGDLDAFEAEYRMSRKQGGWLWVHGRAKAISRENGKAVRLVGTHTDINERKWIEQQLLAREAQFRSIVSNIPGVVFRRLNNEDSTLEYVSDNVLKIFGYEASSLIGKPLSTYQDLIHNEDKAVARSTVQNAMQKAESYSIEYRVVNADGETRWVLEKGSAIFEASSSMHYLDGVIFDITETHALTEQLSYREYHDELTGLINRKQFTREVQKAVSASQHGDAGYALCYVDLDDFKVANDTCGHIGGDKLLGEMGQTFRSNLRDQDIVARLGGDEFGILLRDCSSEYLEKVSASICKAAENFRFYWKGNTLRVGASVGVVNINSSAQSVEDLLRQSEAACYVAKEAGRNRAHLYRENDAVVVRRTDEMQWVSRLHRALEENRFSLWQQPIVPLGDDGDSGLHYEVLIRMRTRGGELATPGSFLPAAERFHLAQAIDRWVITRTMEWLAARPDHINKLSTCSINLSGQSLTDKAFCSHILDLIKVSQVPPEKLCFEITETTAIANIRSAQQFLNTLRKHGCRTALDDFGAGLSSFGYLANFPADYIKIDGMFVKDIAENPIHYAMVRAINEVGQLMGKQTIAEFVESDVVAEKLTEIGVNFGQGYGIGRPRPIDELDMPALTKQGDPA